MSTMFEAVASEFSFVEALPKTEKSRLVKVWDLFKQMKEISGTEGDLLPLMFAAKLLDLSRTRMDQLIADGRLKRYSLDGHVFITSNSIVEFAKTERKNGRPLKVPSVSETFKISRQYVRETCEKKSK